jgi:lysozyme
MSADPVPASPDHYCDGVIDVSHWEADAAKSNHRTLEDELRDAMKAGIVWCIMKTTHGKDVIDPSFHAFLLACKTVGLLYSTYHFPTNSAPGDVQADWYLTSIESAGVDPSTTPLCLDRETNDPSPTHTESYDDACKFVDKIYRTVGKYPMVYGNPSFLATTKAGDPLSKCPLWIAQYGGKVPRIPAAWSRWVLWQNTDGKYAGDGYTNYTPGFGHIDRSVYRGTEAELRAQFSTIGLAA